MKVLAWSALTAALLFAILMMVALFAGASLGDAAPTLVFWAAIPLVSLAIVLALSLLVVSAFSSDSR
jgi:hypothetical protein